ncbi:MAG: hypothetical protein IKO22_02775 [Oscillospiraceae bacterium]|nr:hypothetical protein [Oscillospiraceae bacterium]
MQNDRILPHGILSKRGELLKLCSEKGLSPSQIVGIVEPMRGKTNSEKEALAAQLIEQLSTGKAPT